VQAAGGQRLTQTGLSLGTPHYMSPEQAWASAHIDARTDIYALGAVTYEMLIGEPPFTGATVQSIVAKVMTERPTPPSAVRDTIPEAVEDAVLKALAKLRRMRFSTAASSRVPSRRLRPLPALAPNDANRSAAPAFGARLRDSGRS
jgi:serine/threonine-protein kinase